MAAIDRHSRNGGARRELTLSEELSTIRNARRCGHPIPAGARRDAAYCSNACRQRAYRARRAGAVVELPLPSVSRQALLDTRAENRKPARSAARSSARSEPRVLPELPPHDHSPRLCAVCISARHAQLRAAPRARVNATAVAETIRSSGGDVWPAVQRFGISYEHALQIRRGWRGAGRWADPIRYRSRGWSETGQNGHSSRAGGRLLHRYRITVLDGAGGDWPRQARHGATA